MKAKAAYEEKHVKNAIARAKAKGGRVPTFDELNQYCLRAGFCVKDPNSGEIKQNPVYPGE